MGKNKGFARKGSKKHKHKILCTSSPKSSGGVVGGELFNAAGRPDSLSSSLLTLITSTFNVHTH